VGAGFSPHLTGLKTRPHVTKRDQAPCLYHAGEGADAPRCEFLLINRSRWITLKWGGTRPEKSGKTSHDSMEVFMAKHAIDATTSLCTVLDPRGQPTAMIKPLPLAPRLSSLEGKTVYVIDVGFGGGWEFLEETVGWFARNLPGVRTVLQRKKSIMFADEPEMWEEIRKNGDAVIFGVGG
jgi:hypothetical protein